ncbi:hypothetical protein ACIQTZ_17925 [Paenarthrobacter sp. NPDC090520]|uniref:hypothetical protein n=1 Tax=Paenarthrobacter sp. NPDC090520 TaxID=3364382 RepID=UPI003826AFD8
MNLLFYLQAAPRISCSHTFISGRALDNIIRFPPDGFERPLQGLEYLFSCEVMGLVDTATGGSDAQLDQSALTRISVPIVVRVGRLIVEVSLQTVLYATKWLASPRGFSGLAMMPAKMRTSPTHRGAITLAMVMAAPIKHRGLAAGS